MRLIFSQLIYMYIIICVSAHFTLDLARHDLCPLIHSAILTLKYTLHACAIYYCYHDGKTCCIHVVLQPGIILLSRAII